MAGRCALNRRSRRPWCRSGGGFTLLEILLVMVIVAVLATTVAVGFGSGGEGRRVQIEAERLAMVIEMARQKALRRNEVWGLRVDDTSYGFEWRDAAGDSWIAAESSPFTSWSAADGIRFEAGSIASERSGANRGLRGRFGGADDEGRRQRGRDGEEDEDQRSLPDFAFYPGGEMTPLSIVVSTDGTSSWVARSDGFERVQAAPLGDTQSAIYRFR